MDTDQKGRNETDLFKDDIIVNVRKSQGIYQNFKKRKKPPIPSK